MKDSDVIQLDEPRLSLADQFYFPQVLNGLGTTMKHMFAVLGGKDRVIQYPEEKREDIPVEQGGMLLRTYRGVHRLNKDEEGRVKCVPRVAFSQATESRKILERASGTGGARRERSVSAAKSAVRVQRMCANRYFAVPQKHSRSAP